MALTYNKHAMKRTMCSMCRGLVSGPRPLKIKEDPSNVTTKPIIGLMIRFSCDISSCISNVIKTVKNTTIMSSICLLI